MASYKAIAAVGQAIVQVLTAACKSEELKALPDKNISGAKFYLFQAVDFKDADKLPTKGATVYLYRVGVNAGCRNLPARKDVKEKSFHPSLPLDLYFLITPWAEASDMQYYLLGWMMRMLENTHHMPAALLNEGLDGENIFFPNESVELIFDPLPLSDMAILWENLKTEKVLPSVTYVVRGVLIDSEIELVTAGPAQTREFQFRKFPEDS